jgi:hypothetical protein
MLRDICVFFPPAKVEISFKPRSPNTWLKAVSIPYNCFPPLTKQVSKRPDQKYDGHCEPSVSDTAASLCCGCTKAAIDSVEVIQVSIKVCT